MKTLIVALALPALSPAAPAPRYCNTKQQCVANGGRVSSQGMKCLYNDGQVKSFVSICGTPDYGIPFGCANGEDDASCDYNPKTNPGGFRD